MPWDGAAADETAEAEDAAADADVLVADVEAELLAEDAEAEPLAADEALAEPLPEADVQAESVANENAPPNATTKLLLVIDPMAVSFHSSFLPVIVRYEYTSHRFELY